MSQLSVDEIIKMPFFFIIGRPRTGTTLLRSMLEAHENVLIPLEGPFVLQLFGKFHRVTFWTEEILNNVYNDLMIENNMEFLTIDNWRIDKEKLKADLLSCKGENTFGNICKVINGNFPAMREKKTKIIGDKNPVYANKVNYLLKLYPDAKYIILTRDYRDHIQSMHKVDFGQIITPILAFRWRKFIRTNKKHMKKHPDNFMWLRYEDLAAEPAKYFQDICDFLKIPYDEKVLDFYKMDTVGLERGYKELQEKYHQSLMKPITTKSVGEWKKKMKDIDVKMADAIVGKYAKIAGYERKYNKVGFLLWLKLIPVSIYLRLTDVVGDIFLKHVDPRTNMKIIARGPVLLMKYWRIVHKDNSLSNENK